MLSNDSEYFFLSQTYSDEISACLVGSEICIIVFFFFFKQKTAYVISACLVGSEMCIRERWKLTIKEKRTQKKQHNKKRIVLLLLI